MLVKTQLLLTVTCVSHLREMHWTVLAQGDTLGSRGSLWSKMLKGDFYHLWQKEQQKHSRGSRRGFTCWLVLPLIKGRTPLCQGWELGLSSQTSLEQPRRSQLRSSICTHHRMCSHKGWEGPGRSSAQPVQGSLYKEGRHVETSQIPILNIGWHNHTTEDQDSQCWPMLPEPGMSSPCICTDLIC